MRFSECWLLSHCRYSKSSTNSVRLCIQGNMRHWIEDPDCRDQYSVIYEAGERTAIFNNDAKDPITAEERAVSQKLISWGRFKWNLTIGLQNNTSVCLIAALDRDVCALVSQRHLPGHLPPAWHCIVGRREVQTDSEVQPSGCVPHRLLTMWEVTSTAVRSSIFLTLSSI